MHVYTCIDYVCIRYQPSLPSCYAPSSTANRHFLKAMARVGAGAEEFFDTKTKSKWEGRVKAQLSKAFQPALTSVAVEWQQHDHNAPKPMQVTAPLPMSSFISTTSYMYV